MISREGWGVDMRTFMRAIALPCVVLLVAVIGTGAASADERGTVTSSAPYLAPIEPYAGYQPQTTCVRKPKPGVLMLADWLVARGGGYGPITRGCARNMRPPRSIA